MPEEANGTRGLVGKYVGTYAFVDGKFEVRWKAPVPALSDFRYGPVRHPRGGHGEHTTEGCAGADQ